MMKGFEPCVQDFQPEEGLTAADLLVKTRACIQTLHKDSEALASSLLQWTTKRDRHGRPGAHGVMAARDWTWDRSYLCGIVDTLAMTAEGEAVLRDLRQLTFRAQGDASADARVDEVILHLEALEQIRLEFYGALTKWFAR